MSYNDGGHSPDGFQVFEHPTIMQEMPAAAVAASAAAGMAALPLVVNKRRRSLFKNSSFIQHPDIPEQSDDLTLTYHLTASADVRHIAFFASSQYYFILDWSSATVKE